MRIISLPDACGLALRILSTMPSSSTTPALRTSSRSSISASPRLRTAARSFGSMSAVSRTSLALRSSTESVEGKPPMPDMTSL